MQCADTTQTNGCESCYAGDLNHCFKCNETANFRHSKRDKTKCVCNENYDFVDNQCVRPIQLYVQPTPNPNDIIDLGDKLKDENNDGNYKVDGVSDEKGKYNGKSFSTDDKSVTVDDRYKNDPFYFTIQKRDAANPFKVKVPKDANNVTLDCTDTSIKIPAENEIFIFGSETITIDSDDDKGKTVSVGRVSIKPGQNLELNSNNANISLKELDISGDHTFKGQSNGETRCIKLLVEEGSEFTPLQVTFEDIVRIGKQAQLKANKDEKVIVKGIPFELFYGQRNYGNQIPPLKFSGSKDGVEEFLEGCSAKIRLIEGSSPLPKEENENFTIAEFDFGDAKVNEKACENFKFENSENFKNAVCEKDDEPGTTYRKVATKNIHSDGGDGDGKKKNKLSAGAIAGIVIACVVVVAANIALLVYFLVIKKKNAATTSTQGDSSIAI